MTERYDENLILGYIEGDLAPEERSRFEQVLNADERLRSLVRKLMEDRQALRQWPDESAPTDLLERSNLRLERQMLLNAPSKQLDAGRWNYSIYLGRWAAYGAVAALVLVALGLIAAMFTDTWQLPGIPGGLGGRHASAPAVSNPIAALEPQQAPVATGGASESVADRLVRQDLEVPAAPAAPPAAKLMRDGLEESDLKVAATQPILAVAAAVAAPSGANKAAAQPETPELQIRVASPHVAESLKEIIAWVTQHNFATTAVPSGAAAAAGTPANKVALHLTLEQAASLLTYLNAQPGQEAALVNAPWKELRKGRKIEEPKQEEKSIASEADWLRRLTEALPAAAPNPQTPVTIEIEVQETATPPTP